MDCLYSHDSESVQMSSVPSVPPPNRSLWSATKSKMVFRPKDFIGLELSLVPQVEKVYVACLDAGKEIRVLTIVNERDADARAQIYRREQAIMAELKYSDFDFQIVSRENRCLAEVFNPVGELAYKR